MKEKQFTMFAAAGLLLLISGGIFALLEQWLCAALLWLGSIGCFAAAYNFKNQKNEGRK